MKDAAHNVEWVSWMLLTLAVLVLPGCTAKHYRKSADREAAKVIAQKTPLVPNMDPKFTIEQEKTISLDGLPVKQQGDDFLGRERESEIGAKILSLDTALDLAVKHSRLYQNQKELVFLEALRLTLARYRFTPIFGAGANASYQTRVLNVEEEIERLTGSQIVRETRTVQEQQLSLAGRGQGRGSILAATGTRLATDFTTDFLRFLTGNPRWVTSSRLGATLSQPLLRGAGFKVTLENLTQAERNLLYTLREYTRYRKSFSVQVASAYYNVLQNRDQARNTWLGYENFKQNVARERAFVDEGQRPLASLGQLQQAELSTETQWINAVRTYKESLDQFKILLGLPTDARIVLDETEIDRLKIQHPNILLDEAVKVALATRLDLYNERDQFEDAGRHVGVAANALRADLDLLLRADVDSTPNRPLNLDFSSARWTAGVDLDLPLDRKAERNAYRAALIAYERAGRELQLAVDQIKLDIHQGWRELDQARRNFEIAEIGVKLSERRVEEQELRAELGQGTARDLIEAREDLIDARNRRTGALVRHTIARLEFWRDMGILDIKEAGQWEEPSQYQSVSEATVPRTLGDPNL